MKETMDILICTHEENDSTVLENVKAYFSQEFPTEKLEWKCTDGSICIAQ